MSKSTASLGLKISQFHLVFLLCEMKEKQHRHLLLKKSNLNIWLWLVAILFITFISFSSSIKNGFSNWDDNAYVFNNPVLEKPLAESVPYFFESHYFIGNYIPVTMTAYALQFKTTATNPFFYHKTNLVLHILNVALVFVLIFLMTQKKIAATITALFFGIHPMHTESVAWIAELKDVLYTFFFLISLIVYLNYIQHKHLRTSKTNFAKLFVVFLLFVLSCLSKPAAVILPLILFLVDYYHQRKNLFQLILEKVPFFIFSGFIGWIAIKAQSSDELFRLSIPFGYKLLFASYSILVYLFKFFIPIQQSIFYPYPNDFQNLPLVFYLAPIFILGLIVFIIYFFKNNRIVVFGSLFFIANLLLVLQFITVGDAMLAERYTYVSYIGLLFIVGMFIQKLVDDEFKKMESFKTTFFALIALFALLFTYFTYSRCKVWNNDDTMASDLLAKFPEDRLALNNKGYILFEQGNYDAAIPLFVKALKAKPNYEMAYINLINAYLSKNELLKADSVNKVAIATMPASARLHLKYGYVLYVQKKHEEAVLRFKKTIMLNKKLTDSYSYLGECLFLLNRANESMQAFEQGLTIDPTNYILLNNKGYLLQTMKRYEEALVYFKQSLAINPNYETAQANLINCEKLFLEQKKINSRI